VTTSSTMCNKLRRFNDKSYAIIPSAVNGNEKHTMSTIDRRTFMLGATLAISAPLWGCGGGSGASMPEVASQQGPTAVSRNASFAALPQSHALEVTSGSGTKIVVGGVGAGPGKFNYPIDVAVLDDKAYVVETGNHRVQVFDNKGNSLGMLGEGILNYPAAIAAAAGELLVSDSRNARIVGFDTQGNVTRVIGQGFMSSPRGLVATADGLLVADPGLHKILRLDAAGRLVGDLGGQWILPYDVATDGTQIYLADAGTTEITVLNAAGDRVGSIPLDRSPTYVTFRSDTLYVV
jgi:DNA-binding beta-propeller fold protein YncE